MAGSSGASGESLELNIMPMLDIFSIMIVFLLMSYSTDPISYDLESGVELPESDTLSALDEHPYIVVTKDEILVNDNKVASIFSGDVPKEDRNQGAVYPVFVELEKLAEANKRMMRQNPQLPKNKINSITMVMDQGHKFKLMKRIMLAAQQAEFITFKLSVARKNN